MNPVIEQFDYLDLSYENLKTGEQYPIYKFSLVIPIYIDNEEEILYLSTTQKIKLD